MAYTKNYNLPPLGREVEKRLKIAKRAASEVGFAIVESSELIKEFDQKEVVELVEIVKKMPFERINNSDLIRQRCVGYANIYHLNDLLYFLYPEYDPQNGHFIQSYNLPSDVNPDFKNVAGGSPRNYLALDPALVANTALHKLINVGYQMSPLPTRFEDKPMEVEIQFIKYVPREGKDAKSTPTTVHQDKDWAFCVFLINRENVEGGENSFVKKEYVGKNINEVPANGILKRHTFTKIFDGASVDDQQIGHHVAPVSLMYGKGTGERTIVILSYKPLVPSRPELFEDASVQKLGLPTSKINTETTKKLSKSKKGSRVKAGTNLAVGGIQPSYLQNNYWF